MNSRKNGQKQLSGLNVERIQLEEENEAEREEIERRRRRSRLMEVSPSRLRSLSPRRREMEDEEYIPLTPRKVPAMSRRRYSGVENARRRVRFEDEDEDEDTFDEDMY